VPAGARAALYEKGWQDGLWIGDDAGPIAVDTLQGPRLFPDMTRSEARAGWAGLYGTLCDAGFDGVRQVADLPSLPVERVMRGDESLGGERPWSRYEPAFRTLAARAAHEGLKGARPDARPFIVTDGGFIGVQRFAVEWAVPPGSDAAPDAQIEAAVEMVINAGLSGLARCGVEVPPGAKGSDGTAFARALGVASMMPLVRIVDRGPDRPGLPWSFGPEIEATCRRALERRSRLLPYLYAEFLDAYRFGQPVVRPLFLADPKDPALRASTGSFILGPNIVVRMRPDAPMPPGGWRAFDFGDADPLLPALFIREGAIVPTGPVVRHADEKPLDPLTLLVCPDEQGVAEGTLYEDAGDGYAYLQNQARMAFYRATTEDGAVVVKMIRLDGALGMANRALVVRVLLRDGREATGELRDGLDVRVKLP
jgi:alpha-glucosidase